MSERGQDELGIVGLAVDPEFETGPDHVKRRVSETIAHAEAVAALAVVPDMAGRLRAARRTL